MDARVLSVLICLALVPACRPTACRPITPSTASGADSDGHGQPEPVRAKTCAECHPLIAAEWSASRHGRSTLALDPLYRHLYEQAMGHNPGHERGCRRCHYPASAAQGHPDDGVSCLGCHRLANDHPEPMPDGRIAALASDDRRALCLACHDTLARPDGLQVCTTGPEAAQAEGLDCAGCHMPMTPGPAHQEDGAKQHRGHAFPGAFDPSFVAGCAKLSIEIQADRFRVRIEASPEKLGHALPTGNPMRHVVLRLSAYDVKGKLIWTNLEAAAAFKDPQAVFMRLFHAGDGRAPVPPFLAAGLARDNRLQPGVPTEVEHPLPAGTSRLVAELDLILGPAKLLSAAQVPPSWAAPRPITRAEVSLQR